METKVTQKRKKQDSNKLRERVFLLTINKDMSRSGYHFRLPRKKALVKSSRLFHPLMILVNLISWYFYFRLRILFCNSRPSSKDKAFTFKDNRVIEVITCHLRTSEEMMRRKG
jgi:hypothetical protein